MKPGVDALTQRRELTLRYGVFAYDLFRSHWFCDRCARPVDGAEPMVVPTAAYRSSAELISTQRRALVDALAEAALPLCPHCEAPARFERAQYHVFHSGRGCDLIFGFGHPTSDVAITAQSADGAPIAVTLDAADEAVLRRDAILRHAGALADHRETALLVEALAEALVTLPGDPQLMRFLPRLCAVGALAVATGIAETRRLAQPDAADGHFWSAQVRIERAACTGERVGLSEVEALLRDALARQPDYPDAEIALTNVARLRGDAATASAVLRALLSRHPDHPEGAYTLGLLVLDDAPAEALALFTAGALNAPRDADYPRGQARALLRLGRLREARVAAEQALALAPDDARLDELLASIDASTSTTTTATGSDGAGKDHAMSCPKCGGPTEDGTGGTYVRCTKCLNLFMNMNGALTHYAVDDSMRSMMEQALGFAPSGPPPKLDVPTTCPQCQGALENLEVDDSIFTRCGKCGLLSRQEGQYLMPVVVQSPTGGWDAEFQAIFEEKLGFKKRLQKKPPGVV